MFKKLSSIILIIIGIYILLIFLKPGTTDFLEKKIGSSFSEKIRYMKLVFDGKKTMNDFQKYLYNENPDIKKVGNSINSGINNVKGSIDSIRKKALDTKKSIDENIEFVENGIQKIEKTKDKIEKITKILKDDGSKYLTGSIDKKENITQVEDKIDEKYFLEERKENIAQVEDKIDEKIKKDILEKESELNKEKIYYDVMGDINDF